MKRWQKVSIIPALVVVGLGFAGTAAAHVPTHGASCDGITVGGTKYTEGGSVDLTIDSAHSHHSFNGPTFSYSLGNPDKTKSESWSIVIVSNAADGSASYEGTVAACQTTSSTVPNTTIPTTTQPRATTTTSSPVSSSSAPSTTGATSSTVAVTTSTPTTVPASSSSPSTSSAPTTSIAPTSTVGTTNSSTPTSGTIRSTSGGSTSSTPGSGAPTTLPATGVDISAQLYGAGVLLLAGIAAICLTRRKRLSVLDE